MLKKIIIEDFHIYGFKKMNLKPITIDFENGKVIITGGNGIGKTSLINLIVGIFTNDNNWYSHVRYEKVDFYFNDKKLTINNIPTIISFENANKHSNKNLFERELNFVRTIIATFKKHINIFKSKHQDQIKDFLNEKMDFEEFFNKMNRFLEKSDEFINVELKISEINTVINCHQYESTKFIESLVSEMRSYINQINSILIRENQKI